MNFSFTAPLWRWDAEKATWYFVTLPRELSEEIRFFVCGQRAGFGSVRVTVTIGNSTWKTSLFPSKERGSYLLPIKASVRFVEGLSGGSEVTTELEIYP